jgi:small subunit ribosomal protein S19e
LKIYEVPATELIESIAKEFQGKLTQPEFALWVKTGTHRERSPNRKDWWYVRTASILYRVYADGPVGTESLRTYYGGRKNRGVKPEKFRKAGGKIIRTCLQALEKEGLIKKGKKGREITPKGQSYLNSKARELTSKLTERKKIELIETKKEKTIEEKKEVKEKPKEEKKQGLKRKTKNRKKKAAEKIEEKKEVKEKPKEEKKTENVKEKKEHKIEKKQEKQEEKAKIEKTEVKEEEKEKMKEKQNETKKEEKK